MSFCSEMALVRCCWIKLGLLIADQEAQDPQASPHGYVATILWPSASLIPCSPRPAATRETRQPDSSIVERKKGLASASVSDRATWAGERAYRPHEAGNHLA